jgi:hypothetical protein
VGGLANLDQIPRPLHCDKCEGEFSALGPSSRLLSMAPRRETNGIERQKQ